MLINEEIKEKEVRVIGDDGETLYVHQFMNSETRIDREGKTLTVEQLTDYPRDGRVKITVTGGATGVSP